MNEIAFIIAVAGHALVGYFILRGNLDGGPWSDYGPGWRRFWHGA